MLSRLTLYGSILMLITLLAACEGNTQRKWVIRNDSSETLQVSGRTTSSSTFYKAITPDSEKVIVFDEESGGNSTPQDPEDAFSQLIITTNTGDTVQKNYLNSGNWITTVEKVKDFPVHYEHEYIFTVQDGDF